MAAAAADPTAASLEDEGLMLRLCWVKFPPRIDPNSNNNNNNINDNKKELFWPALKYNSHQEAADFGNHQGFQDLLAEPLFEVIMNEAPDPGPVYRLLGFEDGTFLDDANGNQQNVLHFVRHANKVFIPQSKRDQYFDISNEEDALLWQNYQAGFQEARAIVYQNNRRRRAASATTAGTFKVPRKQDADDKDKENHHGENGGGGGGGPDGRPGGGGGATVSAACQKAAAAVLVQQQAVNQTNNETTVTAQTNTVNSEVARLPVQEEVAVPVTNSTPAKGRGATTEEPDPPPATPPFHARSDLFQISANEPWENIWRKMRYSGWCRRTSITGEYDYVFTKPGRSLHNGVEGVDFFATLEDVQAYVRGKIPHWQPPLLVPQNEAAPAAPRRANNFSSSMTVVTSETASPGLAEPAVRQSRRRATTSNYNFSQATSQLRAQDRLWWQQQKIPSLSEVKPLLQKLGIRRNGDGVYELPEVISRDVTIPELSGIDSLRRFLCTKGIPSVPGFNLLDDDEMEVLHQWVSFAHVPLHDLGRLQSAKLPNQSRLAQLLHDFKFQHIDDKYFVPYVDFSGARCEGRQEGVHYFRGIEGVRDYVRRTQSFAFTRDEFDELDDAFEDEKPKDKALLRLWAASSPSPLPSYETSLAEIQQMEHLYPISEDDFYSESEEEEEMMESDESEEENARMESDESEDESASDVNEESAMEEESSSEVDTVDSDNESSSSDSSSSAGSKRTSRLKRKLENEDPSPRLTKCRVVKNNLPWWQKEPIPSFASMKPILKKLGIVKDQSGKFVLPGTDKADNIDNPDSLRAFLCSQGIPKYQRGDINHPKLLPSEKEHLRRWVSFAFVPVETKNSIKILSGNVLSKYETDFAKCSESRIIQFLFSLGFSKDANGDGFFPPNIDAVGRDKQTRTTHLIADLAQIRLYIRSAKQLSLLEEVEDSELNVDADKLCALRLWAALDPSPLRTYDVKSKSGLDVFDFVDDVITYEKPRKKHQPQKPEPFDAPSWWNDSSQERLQALIEETKLKIKKNTSRRRRPGHMSIESLEVACACRGLIEEVALKSRKSIDDILEEILGLGDEGEQTNYYALEKFFCGDEGRMIIPKRLDWAAALVKRWMSNPNGREKGASKSQGKPMADSSPVADIEDADDMETTPPKVTSNRRGSMVEDVALPDHETHRFSQTATAENSQSDTTVPVEETNYLTHTCVDAEGAEMEGNDRMETVNADEPRGEEKSELSDDGKTGASIDEEKSSDPVDNSRVNLCPILDAEFAAQNEDESETFMQLGETIDSSSDSVGDADRFTFGGNNSETQQDTAMLSQQETETSDDNIAAYAIQDVSPGKPNPRRVTDHDMDPLLTQPDCYDFN